MYSLCRQSLGGGEIKEINNLEEMVYRVNMILIYSHKKESLTTWDNLSGA